MNPEILTGIISVSGAVILAGASYWFTKKREHEAEPRREKLEHYKEFVACLSGVVSGEFTARPRLPAEILHDLGHTVDASRLVEIACAIEQRQFDAGDLREGSNKSHAEGSPDGASSLAA